MPLPHITKAEAEAHNVNLDVPSISASGSVTGMRQKYGTVWKQGGQLRVGSFVYNVGPDEIARLWRLGVLKGKRGTPPAPKIESEYTLTLRQWGRTEESTPDWHEEEFERISRMIAEGYTSGEIVAEDASGGWWELSHKETAEEPARRISDAQRVLVRLYGGGDYRHLETLPYAKADAAARAVDDTLFRFLWIELSEAEDGGDLAEAYDRVEAARGQLEEIANALALITRRKFHKGMVAPLNTDGTLPPGIY